MVSSAAMEFDVVPMRDSTVLRADVYRPAGDGPFPVLLQRTSYGKRTPGGVGLVIDTLAAVARGYIVFHQDTDQTVFHDASRPSRIVLPVIPPA